MNTTSQSGPRAIGVECTAATLITLVCSAIGASKCDAQLEIWEFLIGMLPLPVSIWGFLRCPKRPLVLKAVTIGLLALSALVAALVIGRYLGYDAL